MCTTIQKLCPRCRWVVDELRTRCTAHMWDPRSKPYEVRGCRAGNDEVIEEKWGCQCYRCEREDEKERQKYRQQHR